MNKNPSMPFDRSGYYFIALVFLVLIGFWPTYFGKFRDGTADFSQYFHFHAIMAGLWLALLIVQPILIHQKKFTLHRQVGKLSYIVAPLLYLSVILLAHSRIPPDADQLGLNLWIPFKDLFIFSVAYFIAIYFRKHRALHARGMIAAGLVLIEPALARTVINHLVPGPVFMPGGYLITTGTVYAILLVLIYRERHQNTGRWVFPLILGLFVLVHLVVFTEIRLPPWEAFARWFAALPLT